MALKLGFAAKPFFTECFDNQSLEGGLGPLLKNATIQRLLIWHEKGILLVRFKRLLLVNLNQEVISVKYSLALLLLALTISSVSWAKGSTYRSDYTSLKECQLIDEGHDGYWSERECPRQGNYRLFLRSEDLRDSLEIRKGDETVIDLFKDIRAKFGPGFREIPGPIEWRYKGKSVTALIFRVVGSYDEGRKKRSKLFVVRLKGNKACLIGVVASNVKARKLADGKKSCQ